jgi:Copper/zinc superoxide dismutase (SODC)
MNKFLTICISLLLVSCSTTRYGPISKVVFEPNSSSKAYGVLVLEQFNGKISIKGQINGLSPFANYGAYVLDSGECSNTDGQSVRKILTSTGNQQADQVRADRHSVDSFQIKADSFGNALVLFQADLINSGLEKVNLSGKAFVLQQNGIDLKSQAPNSLTTHLLCAAIQDNKVPIQIAADEIGI